MLEEKSYENKRSRDRFDYKNNILCYKHIITDRDAKPDKKPIRIHIEDISYSGIGIECNRDLSMGDFLIFNLEYLGVVKEMMMEVKWCKYGGGNYEAGLQFMNLTKESILFLDDLIKNFVKRKKRLMESEYS